jgi:hypothetical protein
LLAVLPRLGNAGWAAPPKSPPPAAARLLPEKRPELAGAEVAGVAAAVLPKRPPPDDGVVAAGVPMADPPNKPPPAAGVDAALPPNKLPGFCAGAPPKRDPPVPAEAVPDAGGVPRLEKENFGGAPEAAPKRPPAAGADVAGVLLDCAPEVGVEPGAPKLNDMVGQLFVLSRGRGYGGGGDALAELFSVEKAWVCGFRCGLRSSHHLVRKEGSDAFLGECIEDAVVSMVLTRASVVLEEGSWLAAEVKVNNEWELFSRDVISAGNRDGAPTTKLKANAATGGW